MLTKISKCIDSTKVSEITYEFIEKIFRKTRFKCKNMVF